MASASCSARWIATLRLLARHGSPKRFVQRLPPPAQSERKRLEALLDTLLELVSLLRLANVLLWMLLVLYYFQFVDRSTPMYSNRSLLDSIDRMYFEPDERGVYCSTAPKDIAIARGGLPRDGAMCNAAQGTMFVVHAVLFAAQLLTLPIKLGMINASASTLGHVVFNVWALYASVLFFVMEGFALPFGLQDGGFVSFAPLHTYITGYAGAPIFIAMTLMFFLIGVELNRWLPRAMATVMPLLWPTAMVAAHLGVYWDFVSIGAWLPSIVAPHLAFRVMRVIYTALCIAESCVAYLLASILARGLAITDRLPERGWIVWIALWPWVIRSATLQALAMQQQIDDHSRKRMRDDDDEDADAVELSKMTPAPDAEIRSDEQARAALRFAALPCAHAHS